jgi:hypothetical integral membrane protein (TIGR02206 family)
MAVGTGINSLPALFSIPHLSALVIVVLICLLLFLLRNRFSPRRRLLFRWCVALLLVANELAYHAWNVYSGLWSAQTMLPLNICSLLVFASAYLLAARSYPVYEFCYFLGIGAASQVLVNPDLGVIQFPHFLFFQTSLAHGLIVIAAVFMTVVERFRPYPKSLLKVALGMNAYLLLMAVVNRWLGGNYLFLARKPDTPTLLDLLGPWPWYILGMEAVGMVIAGILYLPFLVRDRVANRVAVLPAGTPKGL